MVLPEPVGAERTSRLPLRIKLSNSPEISWIGRETDTIGKTIRSDVPERQGKRRYDQHHAARHKLLGFREANGEHDQKRCHD